MNRLEVRDSNALQQQTPGSEKSIFISGATGFLGGHFLLKRITWPGRVFALVRGDCLIQARQRLYAHLAECADSYGTLLPESDLDKKLVVITGDITVANCGVDADTIDTLRKENIAEFWHCAASLKFEDRHRSEIFSHNIGGTQQMLALFETVCAPASSAEFIHISTAYSVGAAHGDIAEERHLPERKFNNAYEESKNHAENLVVDWCSERGLSYRVLRPSVVMGPRASHHSGTTRFGVYGLTKEIFRLRDTLSRLEHPLQIIGEDAATVNLTPVDECVYDMLSLSVNGFGDQRFFHLCNPSRFNVKQIIALIDSKTGANRVQMVPSREGEPSPLQDLFDTRTRFYAGYYHSDKRFQRSAAPQPALNWSDFDLYLSSFLHELRIEEAGGVGFQSQTVTARDGTPLKVLYCGDPQLPALLLVNAYGMPAEFYWPLAQRLSTHFHIITWETRWVPSLAHPFDPLHCDSLVHARDLADIANTLKIEAATALGWSSGAQVVLRTMAEFPQLLRRGILLNPGVSIAPSEQVRVTRFEAGIRSLFAKIAGNYRMAEKYVELIFGAAGADAGDRQLLSNILTSTDPYLLYMTSLPFRTPESLFRYAHMMHALFSEREDAWTGDVQRPVLVYVGENDVVTHADIGRALCRGLAQGTLHLDPEGDHFGHYYDARVADLVRAFSLQESPEAVDEV
ncbi:MAG: alpha/beta fold hydrolase [Rhodanobacteraceae bacterium]|nr:alpha/beta fold hydrolase [Rhodanobacteraceae bacterium]